MANASYVHDGRTLEYTPAAAVGAGTIVRIGGLVGITKRDIAANATGALAIDGVYELTKSGTADVAFSVGDDVYWDFLNEAAVSSGVGATSARANPSVLFGSYCRLYSDQAVCHALPVVARLYAAQSAPVRISGATAAATMGQCDFTPSFGVVSRAGDDGRIETMNHTASGRPSAKAG